MFKQSKAIVKDDIERRVFDSTKATLDNGFLDDGYTGPGLGDFFG